MPARTRASFASLRSVASRASVLGDVEAEPSFPTWDLLLLAAMRFAEPISFTSINPYLFFMIKSFGVKERDVGFYAGVVASSFPLAEFATGVFWGRLSDKLGRRKVILICLGGCIIPTLLFGFSESVLAAVVWRTITGLINGNAPVIATACAELVTFKPHQALAFSIVPISWSVGSILGPIIGGTLADPVGQHPGLFHGKLRELFTRFPYALPNIVASVLFAIALVFGVIYLKETKLDATTTLDDVASVHETTSLLSHNPYNHRRRDSVVSISTTHAYEPAVLILPPSQDESSTPHLLEPPPHLHGHRGSKSRPNPPAQTPRTPQQPPPASTPSTDTSFWQDAKQFNFQIQLALVLFAILAFHTMAGDQIFPLFCSTSREAGGLALDAKSVGALYSVTSIGSLALQIIFPYAHRLLGSKGCLVASSVCGLISYALLPSLVYLPKGGWLFFGSCVAILFLRASSILGYPAITILITNAVPAPSPKHPNSILGTVNGMMQSVGSLARSLGSLTMGAVFAWSLSANVPLFSWGLCGALAVVVLVGVKWQHEESGTLATEPINHMDTVIEEEDDDE